jgi:hypothetical protein
LHHLSSQGISALVHHHQAVADLQVAAADAVEAIKPMAIPLMKTVKNSKVTEDLVITSYSWVHSL